MMTIGLIASLLMGGILGLVGGGGSILTVPILIYLFGLSATLAATHSLFIVGLTALIGSYLYWRKNEIDFSTAIVFAIPSSLGVYLTRSFLIPSLPEVFFQSNNIVVTKEFLILFVFSMMMFAASYSMIFKQTMVAERSPQAQNWLLLAGQAMLVGSLAGFVGAGGGFLIVPALIFWAGLNMRKAAGTSLLIIAIQSSFGFLSDYLRKETINWTLLGSVSLAAIVGIGIGSHFSRKLPERNLKVSFCWLVVEIAVFILVQQLKELAI
jgi:uncharacterized membrane protein YfcA